MASKRNNGRTDDLELTSRLHADQVSVERGMPEMARYLPVAAKAAVSNEAMAKVGLVVPFMFVECGLVVGV